MEISQPLLRNEFHPLGAGRSELGEPVPGTSLPAGVSLLGWIEEATGWPTLPAPQADVRRWDYGAGPRYDQ